jgi:16S rRNA (guanine527-N7)-methyltransferase
MDAVKELALKPSHRAELRPLAELLCQWNKAHNLVSRKLSDDQILNLLWEATAFERLLPQGAEVADLGAGAGIPALPLALIRSDLKITAVEPRQKRCVWLRFAAAKLGISMTVLEASWKPEWDHFERVISRAVFAPKDFEAKVGASAARSLQMTGLNAGRDHRSRYTVLRERQRVGLILAGASVADKLGA